MTRPVILTANFWSKTPPWLVAGVSLVLFPLFGYITFSNIQNLEQTSYRMLLEKGAALIRAFEAGTRAGVATSQWQGFKLQSLLMETAQQPDIRYLFVVREDGTILSHNQPDKVGFKLNPRTLPDNFPPEGGADPNRTRGTLYWRVIEGVDGTRTFEVFRPFLPKSDKSGILKKRIAGHLDPAFRPGTENQSELVIFVGLDMKNIDSARMTDMLHTMMTGGVLLLIGLAGVVFVFVFQSFQTARSNLDQIRAFSNHLVDNMPMGLVALDTKLRIRSMNAVATRLLQLEKPPRKGTAAKKILPKPLFAFLSVADPASSALQREGLLEEVEWVTEDQTVRTEAALSRLKPAGIESQGGYMLLIRDLSEVDALRKEVARSQRLATVGKLAAGVAHEIRNPLSSIKGFATLIGQRHGEDPKDRQISDIMIQEVDRLNRVVGQLLDFSRPLCVMASCVDLRQIVDSTLCLVEEQAERKAIRIGNRVETGLIAHLDADKVRQVLLNLYLNAIDAMEEDGHLIVDGRIDDTEIRLQVTDTGCGIEDAELPHIFDPYFTTKTTGTGLGLAIAHNIMEAHKGTISVNSLPGQGTVITLCFPRKEMMDATDDPHRG